jgi:hypothetical protein
MNSAFYSGVLSMVVAISFGRLFIRSAKAPVPTMPGQYAEKPWW